MKRREFKFQNFLAAEKTKYKKNGMEVTMGPSREKVIKSVREWSES